MKNAEVISAAAAAGESAAAHSSTTVRAWEGMVMKKRCPYGWVEWDRG